jgi:hypothetical protein
MKDRASLGWFERARRLLLRSTTMGRARILLVTLGACAAALGLWLPRSAETATARKAPAKRAAQTSRVVEPARPAPPPTIALAAAPVARANPPGDVVVTATWGGGAGQLGRRAANESSPEGPMSFAVDSRGRAFVLDQINARVSVFEAGSVARSIALPSETIQDIALRDDDRGLVALDRFGSEEIAFVDASGSVTHRVPLVGQGVESGGDVTALTQREDGTWVEVKHERLVQIADGAGAPVDPRPSVPGRFTASGGFVRASKSGSRAVSLALLEPGQRARALARVELPMRVWQVLGLESTPDNRFVIAADLYEESPAPAFERIAAVESVVVLSGEGVELQRFELPATDGAEESFRRLRVGGDGAIYHMGFSDAGVTIRRLSR